MISSRLPGTCSNKNATKQPLQDSKRLFFYKQNMQLLKCDDIAQFQPPTEHCFADET